MEKINNTSNYSHIKINKLHHFIKSFNTLKPITRGRDGKIY